MAALRIGGVFSGIGGGELGSRVAGHRVVYLCEHDPYCRQVLHAQFPSVLIKSGITEVRVLPDGIDLAVSRAPSRSLPRCARIWRRWGIAEHTACYPCRRSEGHSDASVCFFWLGFLGIQPPTWPKAAWGHGPVRPRRPGQSSERRQRRTAFRSRRQRGTTFRSRHPGGQATWSSSRVAVPVMQDAGVHWEQGTGLSSIRELQGLDNAGGRHSLQRLQCRGQC